jgi:anti-sigma factor (TIGR02949 family)
MTINFTNWMSRLFRKDKSKSTCKECLESLQLLVDGETTKEQEDYFKRHLNECLPCYDFYNLEKSVKEVLKSKIEKRPVPASLAENIRTKLKRPQA